MNGVEFSFNLYSKKFLIKSFWFALLDSSPPSLEEDKSDSCSQEKR